MSEPSAIVVYNTAKERSVVGRPARKRMNEKKNRKKKTPRWLESQPVNPSVLEDWNKKIPSPRGTAERRVVIESRLR